MMIDDDEYEYHSLPITSTADEYKPLGTSGSKWANAPNTSRHTTTTTTTRSLAYLDNDPTLIAPKRPFRPGDQAYQWASNINRQPR